MGLLVHRRLAIPVSAIALVTAGLTARAAATRLLVPPTTAFVVATLGITTIGFFVLGAIRFLRASRSLVRILPSGHWDQTRPEITTATRICVRTVEDSNRSAAEDALDLVRMDDDGGCQIARQWPSLRTRQPDRL